MSAMDEFKIRVSHVLSKIMENEEISAESLAESLEIDTGALDDFLNRRAIFETEDIHRLTNLYNVNVLWIYTGRKSPFYQDGERPMGMEVDTGDADRSAASAEKSEIAPEMILDCLEKVARILASKKPSAAMLAMLVDAYYRILQLENENKELERSLAKKKN